MATNDSTEKRQLSEGDLKQIEGDLSTAGILFMSILEWARASDAEVNTTALEVMCEKGGYLADRSVALFGHPGIAGSFDRWMDMGRLDAEAEAEAQVTA